jgi:hypothetical protein
MNKQQKTAAILLKLTPSKKAELKAKAQSNESTLTAYITKLITDSDISGTSTGQEYYFRYENYWYKTTSKLTDEVLLVTVIDPLCREYKTKFLKIEDKFNIDFYSDFEELLIDFDTESWGNDIKNGTLSDSQRRHHFHMSYLRFLNPNDKEYSDYFKGI